jgi:hypothetical protein
LSKCCFQMQLVPLHHGEAAQNISAMYSVKRRAMQWCRKAADMGVVVLCLQLARDMYEDRPHAHEVGHVEVEAIGVAMSAADMEGPPGGLDERGTLGSEGVRYRASRATESTRYSRRASQKSGGGGSVLRQRRVRGRGPSEGLQGMPAVQDRPVLFRRVAETGLE